jgi:predicted nucleic acid-binding protein
LEYVIDTSFLIGRWRQGRKSPEQRFIDEHPDASVAMPWIVKAEFLRGAVFAGRKAGDLEEFLSRYATLWVSEATISEYVRCYVTLVRENALIGANDLWIAASALEHRLPLLTRNAREFRRVPELEVIDTSAASARPE